MSLISSIDIKAFRGIKSLKLDELAQINILTGDNNCGKTSILEIIESFEEPDSFLLWRSLIRRETTRMMRPGISYYEGFYDLFDVNMQHKELEYTIIKDGNPTNISMYANETEEELSEEQYSEITGFSSPKDETISEEFMQIVPKLELTIKINGTTVNEDAIYRDQWRYFPKKKRPSNKKYVNTVYISPFRHTEGTIFLKDVLNNPELYEEMLAILKEFDEDILSINYSNDDNRGPMGRGVYKILSKSHKQALPLNMYGDGMKKTILLMSAVIRAENGILLLDEFETAIHTSAMDRVFRWILKTCKKLNVQVFMTSHSKEAIEKILKCEPEMSGDIAMYTLYKDESRSSVRRLTAKKAIEVQDEMGLELR